MLRRGHEQAYPWSTCCGFRINGSHYQQPENKSKKGIDHLQRPSEARSDMEMIQRLTLQKYHVKIAENIDVSDLLPYLRDVLDDCDVDRIKSQRTPFQKADKMLNLLSKRGPSAFCHFVRALDISNPHLAKLMMQDLTEVVGDGICSKGSPQSYQKRRNSKGRCDNL